MTQANCKKHGISKAHIQACQRAGFDAYDANKRHNKANPEIETIIKAFAKSPQQDRARALKGDRKRASGLVLGRSLVLALMTISTSLVLPDAAYADPARSGFVYWESQVEREGGTMPAGEAFEWQVQDTVQSGNSLQSIQEIMPALIANIPKGTIQLGLLMMLNILALAQWRTERRILKSLNHKYESETMPETPMPKCEPKEQLTLPLDEMATAEPWSQAHPNEETCHKPRLILSGDTRTGKVREENQDAFRMQALSPSSGLVVLCDGMGGHSGGKEAALFASGYIFETLAKRDQETITERADLSFEANAIWLAGREFVSQDLQGGTTALVASIDGQQLNYATIGDGDFAIIYPDGMVQHVMVPHNLPDGPSNILTAYLGKDCRALPRFGSLHIEPSSLILMMSDGASDLLDLEQMARDRARYIQALLRGENLAKELLDILEAARDPKSNAYLHSDNMTLVMALVGHQQADGGEHA